MSKTGSAMPYKPNTTVLDKSKPRSRQVVRCNDCGCEWVAHTGDPWIKERQPVIRRYPRGLYCPVCYIQHTTITDRQKLPLFRGRGVENPDPKDLPWVKQIVTLKKDKKKMTRKKVEEWTAPNGKTYKYHEQRPKGPSRQCPKCKWYASNSVAYCKCGYVYGNRPEPKTTKPTREKTTTTTTRAKAEHAEKYADKILGVCQTLEAVLTLSTPDYDGNAVPTIQAALSCPGLGEVALTRLQQILSD